MQEREKIVRLWFTMWLEAKDLGIRDIFAEDAVYTESWGPQYKGADAIEHWFAEWNSRAKVVTWDIKQFFHKDDQTIAEWYFASAEKGKEPEGFDGMTLIRWNRDGKIQELKEFGCNVHNYDPYAEGPEPKFRDENAMWF